MVVDDQGGGMAKRRVDPKVEALAQSRTLNPHPEAVTDEQYAAAEAELA